MSSWQCPECRTVYPDGVPACPNHEGVSVAKVGAAGATQYVAEGGQVPGDLPAEVRLVGPGAPRPAVAVKAPARSARAKVRAGAGG